MGSDISEEYNVKESEHKTEAKLALAQAEKMTKQMDRLIYDNPFVKLIDIRRNLVPYCITLRYGEMLQNLIDEAIADGQTWQTAYEFRNFIRRIYEHEKGVRAGPEGPKNISQFGILTGTLAVHKSILVHRLARDFFIEPLKKPGIDAVLIADKGYGKTCFVGQNMIIPWVDEYSGHVVSGIECLNQDQFYIDDEPHYHKGAFKSENFIQMCDLQLANLKNEPNEIQTILVPNDEASQEMNKQRSMTKEALDQDCYLAIERHFGASSIWLFQKERNVPASLDQFSSIRFEKKTQKTVHSTIKMGEYIEITQVGGLKGLEQLKQRGERHFDYPVIGKPDFTPWDINMVKLRRVVNKITNRMTEEQGDAGSSKDKTVQAQINFFTGVREFLKHETESGLTDTVLPTRNQLIKSLSWWLVAWMEEHGKSGKAEAPINYTTICSVIKEEMNITQDVLSKSVRRIAQYMQKNPDAFSLDKKVTDEETQTLRKLLGEDYEKYFD